MSALCVVPMILLTEMLVVMVGQIMAGIMDAMADAFRGAIIAACSPMFLFASLLGDATVEVDVVPLVDIFVDIPSPPVIDIIIG